MHVVCLVSRRELRVVAMPGMGTEPGNSPWANNDNAELMGRQLALCGLETGEKRAVLSRFEELTLAEVFIEN